MIVDLGTYAGRGPKLDRRLMAYPCDAKDSNR